MRRGALCHGTFGTMVNPALNSDDITSHDLGDSDTVDRIAITHGQSMKRERKTERNGWAENRVSGSGVLVHLMG